MYKQQQKYVRLEDSPLSYFWSYWSYCWSVPASLFFYEFFVSWFCLSLPHFLIGIHFDNLCSVILIIVLYHGKHLFCVLCRLFHFAFNSTQSFSDIFAMKTCIGTFKCSMYNLQESYLFFLNSLYISCQIMVIIAHNGQKIEVHFH
jgi:hypothetical protein